MCGLFRSAAFGREALTGFEDMRPPDNQGFERARACSSGPAPASGAVGPGPRGPHGKKSSIRGWSGRGRGARACSSGPAPASGSFCAAAYYCAVDRLRGWAASRRSGLAESRRVAKPRRAARRLGRNGFGGRGLPTMRLGDCRGRGHCRCHSHGYGRGRGRGHGNGHGHGHGYSRCPWQVKCAIAAHAPPSGRRRPSPP